MVYVLITHKVEDVKKWLPVFKNFFEFRKSMGEKSFQVFITPDEPNRVTVLNSWESLEKAKTFLASPKLKDAMKEAGVAEEPRIYFLEEILSPASTR